jgi:hypothetical protein
MRRTASAAIAIVLFTAASARPARADDPAAAPDTAPPLQVERQALEPAAPPTPVPNDPATAAAANAAPPPAPAPIDDRPESPTFRKVTHDRRAGVIIGVSPGIGFAGSSGYPNNSRLVGNPDFYSESPLLVGASTTYFLMGAFTDYINFGPMVNIAKFESDKWKSTGFGVGFRLETFPLLRLFPMLADTSLYGMAGVGSTELQAKGNFPSADGAQSFLGIGLHHELRLFRLLGGHLAGGPYAEYDAIFTPSNERHWASIGFRVAWYGGTVTADKR